MTSTFQLDLDTRPPQLAWGAIGGTTAGDLLRVAYDVDEPAVDSATLTLADGRTLAMRVLPVRLEVLLPVDAPDGMATVTATTVDDVGNQAVWTLDVAIVGDVVGPTPIRGRPTAPMPTGPARRSRGDRRRLVSARSSAIASSRTAVRAAHQVTTTVTPTSRAGTVRTPARGQTFTLTSRSSARVVLTSGPHDTSATLGSRGRVVRRRDGPGLEEALLLDLL